MIHFILNDKSIGTDEPPGLAVLDFIRYHQHLMGTKIGCREGDCGACTVLCGQFRGNNIQYRTVTSCLMPLGNARGKHIVTIEGINMDQLSPIQQAMCDESATQCGFCTPGIVMSLVGFCLQDKEESGNEAEPLETIKAAIAAVDGNICRCTGYKSIEKAALRVAGLMRQNEGGGPVQYLTSRAVLPAYFSNIKEHLKSLPAQAENNSSGTTPGENYLIPSISRKFIAGGTDLYVQQHESMLHSDINFLSTDSSLQTIRRKHNECVIGASVTVTDLIESPLFHHHFPQIRRYVKLISSTPIRNMATIAGNFVNASPIGDLTIFFLALNARLILSKEASTRELPLRQLYKAYKLLNMHPGEYIREIRFELPGNNMFFNFEKVSKRTHLDIATVNTAILIRVEGGIIIAAAVSAGGVGPVPAFLSETSAFLEGKELSSAIIHKANEIAQTEISPISDARGSATYKRLLLKQLLKAHFLTLFPFLELDKIMFE